MGLTAIRHSNILPSPLEASDLSETDTLSYTLLLYNVTAGGRSGLVGVVEMASPVRAITSSFRACDSNGRSVDLHRHGHFEVLTVVRALVDDERHIPAERQKAY